MTCCEKIKAYLAEHKPGLLETIERHLTLLEIQEELEDWAEANVYNEHGLGDKLLDILLDQLSAFLRQQVFELVGQRLKPRSNPIHAHVPRLLRAVGIFEESLKAVVGEFQPAVFLLLDQCPRSRLEFTGFLCTVFRWALPTAAAALTRGVG